MRIAEFEHQLSQRELQKINASSSGKELTSFKLRWTKGERAPNQMCRWCDTVLNGNTVHIRNQGKVEIYSYEVTSDNVHTTGATIASKQSAFTAE